MCLKTTGPEIELLPDNVFVHLCLYFSLDDILALGRVSKRCRELSLLDQVWTRKANLLGLSNTPKNANKSVMTILKEGLGELYDDEFALDSIEKAHRLGYLKLAVDKHILPGIEKKISSALGFKIVNFYDSFKKAYELNNFDNAVLYYTALNRLDQGVKCHDFLINCLQKLFEDSSLYVETDTGIIRLPALEVSLTTATLIFNIQAQAAQNPLFHTEVEKPIFPIINHIINVSQIQAVSVFLETVSAVCKTYESSFLANLRSTADTDSQNLFRNSFLETFELHINAYIDTEFKEFEEFANGVVQKWAQDQIDEEQTIKAFFFQNIKSKSPPKPVAKDTLGMLKQSFNFYNFKPKPVDGTVKGVIDIDMEKILFSAQTLNLTLPSSESDSKQAFLSYQINHIKSLVNMDLVKKIVKRAHSTIDRLEMLGSFSEDSRISLTFQSQIECIYFQVVKTLGMEHIRTGFNKALDILDNYDNKDESTSGKESVINTLTNFTVLVNNADMVLQMIESIYNRCMLKGNRSSLSSGNKIRHEFEKQLDENVARGLNNGITVLLNKINYIYLTEQREIDFQDATEAADLNDVIPTVTAQKVVNILELHIGLLSGANHDSLVELYQQEIGTRFFGTVCKHIKHQTISTGLGSQRLLKDVELYKRFAEVHIPTKQISVLQYFEALSDLVKVYGIPSDHVSELVNRLVDQSQETFQRDELLDFLKCRSDWRRIRREVEIKLQKDGGECLIM